MNDIHLKLNNILVIWESVFLDVKQHKKVRQSSTKSIDCKMDSIYYRKDFTSYLLAWIPTKALWEQEMAKRYAYQINYQFENEYLLIVK